MWQSRLSPPYMPPLLRNSGWPAHLCYAYAQYDVEAEFWHEMTCGEVLEDAVCLMLHPDGKLCVDDMQVPPLAATIWCELRARLPDQLGVRRKRPVGLFAALPMDAELLALDEQIGQLIAEVPRSDAGWLLACPRSPAWWLDATMREGSTLRGQYQRGVSSSGISQTDRSTRKAQCLVKYWRRRCASISST